MKQHSIHKEMIKKVAKKLGPLKAKVVFLGGSATGFHITDKAEPEIRATKDVDIIVEVASRVDFHQLENTLDQGNILPSLNEEQFKQYVHGSLTNIIERFAIWEN